jgi:hypothetical protein
LISSLAGVIHLIAVAGFVIGVPGLSSVLIQQFLEGTFLDKTAPGIAIAAKKARQSLLRVGTAVLSLFGLHHVESISFHEV